ncbi:MAG: TetR/AcrR family transcriptional regulator [Flavobacteriaceae bacterium]
MPKVETFNREQVLNRVIQLFHKKGYSATSMQDLVDATGLNRSSFYNSFGSKKELYQESLKVYRETAHKSIQKVLIHSENPKIAIRKIFTTNQDLKANGCFLSNCTTEMANQDLEIKNFLVNNLEHMQDLFEELVSKGQSEGIINTHKSAKQYAMYLFTSLQGLRITGILLSEQEDFESIVETTLSVLN